MVNKKQGKKKEVKKVGRKKNEKNAKKEIKMEKDEKKEKKKSKKDYEEKVKKAAKTRKEKSEKEKLIERAKELGKKVKEKDLKKEFESEIKKEKTLIPVEDYLKYGVYLGTKVITPHLRKFVYKRRADGIAVIDVNMIDKKIKEAVEFLSEYNPEDVIIVCRREAGWNAVKLFSEITGIKAFTKKYPAGVITNTSLKEFVDPKLVFICDPWVDKNALHDANLTKKKVMALCDTNNYCFGIDFFVPCNNKSAKSIGTVLYLIASGYLREKKIKKEIPPLQEFIKE